MEANHNYLRLFCIPSNVAYDIAKIYIWKQITTRNNRASQHTELLMILQRYTFGSKSQLANEILIEELVAYDIAKIYIWKQITTFNGAGHFTSLLLMILQRYTFGSKSQPVSTDNYANICCL